MQAFSRLMNAFLRTLIFLYQHSLSYFIGRQCRFMPTCSAYADEAIMRYGPMQGSGLAIKRLCRCHPWGESGFDPVPDSLPHSRSNSLRK